MTLPRCSRGLGSARISRVGDGAHAVADFSGETVSAGRRNQHARRARYPAMISL